MKIRVSMLAAIFFSLSGCGQELDVGSGPGGSGEGGPTLSQDGVLSCSPGDCANYSFTCTEGSPKNVQCSVDRSSEFESPICALTGECDPPGVVTCSWAQTPCTGGQACAAPAGGAGVVAVEVAPAGNASASSTVLTAYFNHGWNSEGQAFGDCVYSPDGAELVQSGFAYAPAPRPGIITVTSSGFTESVSPACDGTYAPATTSEAITPGALVNFGFTEQATAGSGDGFPTSLPSVPAPHFIALAASDVLAAVSPSASRATDLAVDWTVTGTPLSLEQVVVVLTQGLKTVSCSFDAGENSGVVPADALLALGAGNTSYQVYSLHEAGGGQGEGGLDGDDEGGWAIRFRVQMAAATPAGLAKGTLRLE